MAHSLQLFAFVLLAFACSAGAQGFGQELANLDFENIIGGPLLAAIDAQGRSAMSTVSFINEVAFHQDGGIRNVRLTYQRLDTIAENETALRNHTMVVPFLTLVPIPYLELEEINLDFNVQLNSAETSSTQYNLDTSSSVSGGFNAWFARTRYKATLSTQYEYRTTGTVKRQYDLRVQVKAVQAPLPKGTERIFETLESVIRKGIPAESDEEDAKRNAPYYE